MAEEHDEGGEEAAVRPSPPLIAILRRRLRDPGLVPSFERRRPLHVTGGLVRPRWVLRHADGVAGELSDVPGDDGPNNAATERYNALPRRNYIDLRMEQNRMFADEQCRQCRARLSKLTTSSNNSNSNNQQQQQQQWKKQANAIQSSIDEGLAACPNHEGLRSVEEDFRVWVREKVDGGRCEGVVARGVARTNTSNPGAAAAGGMQTADNINHHPSHPKKGAEGRAQAAMRDALLERSFLLGDGGHGDDGAAKAANDGNKGEEETNKYPLIPEANDEMKREGNRPRSGSDGDDHSSSSSSRSSHRRRRKRSKHRRKKHKKRSKRRHDRDEDRRRRKGHRRSRSRSRSEGSRSRSGSNSSRSSYNRGRKHRRKEKRRRKHRHRSHGEDYRTKTSDDGRSLDGRSLDERGSGNDPAHGV